MSRQSSYLPCAKTNGVLINTGGLLADLLRSANLECLGGLLQVEQKLGHLDPYFVRLAHAMVAWVEAWRRLNPPAAGAEPAAAAAAAPNQAAAPAAAAAAAGPAAAAPAAPYPALRATGATVKAPPDAAPAPPPQAGAAGPAANPAANPAPATRAAPAAAPAPAALVKLANGHAAGLKPLAAAANGVLANGRAYS